MKIPLVSLTQLRDEVRKNPNVPLVVDLDRTLVVVDVFQTQLAYLLVRRPWQLLAATRQYFSGGLPALKEWVNSRSGLTSGDLKLNSGVVDLIETASCREVELCTGACEAVAIEVSERVSGITSVSSSRGGQNLTGRSKATYLLSKYGPKGFFYIGDSRKDLHVGEHAAAISIIQGPHSANSGLETKPRAIWSAFAGEARIKHWLKNLLVFIPIIAAHEVDTNPIGLMRVSLLFIALSLVASSTYILNDLIDLKSDSKNPLKSERPLVSGQLSIPSAIILAIGLFVSGMSVAAIAGSLTIYSCLFYLTASLGYMYYFKRKALVDVFALASLYVIRVLAGGFVAGIEVTSWLTLFAFFFFFSLAWVKRYTEIAKLGARGISTMPGRAYRPGDESVFLVLGMGAGLSAVLLFSLYIATDSVRIMYNNPEALIAGVPILFYWISHLWLHALRLEIDVDPIDWAARDWRSVASGAAFLLVFAAASWSLP
jgi:4-hydroxybenzoate polyprenyltransferase